VAKSVQSEEEDYDLCEEHGRQKIVGFKRSWGYAGPLYVWTLECGCQIVDASDDIPEM
jgi:hypothetical protein